jgi:hypothetical protein
MLEEPSPEPETSVSGGPEAPAEVASLVPVPAEVAERLEPRPGVSEPATHVHIVRWKGETLSLVAEWYTASWKNWEVLARVNPGIDPNRIEIGNRIRIPERLVTRRDPLPLDLLRPSTGRTGLKRAEEEATTVAGEIGLFGPVEATTRHKPAPEGIELFEPAEITGKPAQIPEETGLFGPME